MNTTTIYVPTSITSAEQAASYPQGTVAIRTLPDELGARTETAVREDLTGTIRWSLGPGGFPHEGMVNGWFALVPVEVEVEQLRETAGRHRAKTLYVSPWQEPAG
ncbi:MAG TPA: hypothetical protein K8W24_15800 [Brachybacterium paraconglomeratum]|uniref:Uncharacterized protein n=1 Tax=Brachybacterium paraconglomeratum TaxID=173362 RepID=A0A921GS18_9MICO|nr:hypothetical protein [Brachybacterium paraconglomeratum]